MKRLGPVRYLAASLAVFASQHALLLLVLASARADLRHLPWWFWLNPVRTLVGPSVISQEPGGAVALGMFATLAVDAALILLAFRRAKEVEGRSWAAALTIVPIVQIGAILSLTVARDHALEDTPEQTRARLNARASAWGVLLGVGLIVCAVAVSTLVFGVYGYALFLISPFLIAVAVGYLANREGGIGSGQTSGLVCLAFLLGAAALLGFAFEGAICLVLASPLIAVIGLLGGWLGRSLATLGRRGRGTTLTSVAFIPILIVAEAVLPPRATFENIERIDIAAPPSAVWDAVVHMSAFNEPPQAPFRWGLAYPLRGEIVGNGVGALRRSVFSTGDALERVTAWRPGSELSFAVLQEPPAMREFSPFSHVNAPHRSGYFRTREVTFRLVPLLSGGTRLSLASIHDLDLEPALYWIPLAQWAVHANKLRVLQHLRGQAAPQVAASAPDARPKPEER